LNAPNRNSAAFIFLLDKILFFLFILPLLAEKVFSRRRPSNTDIHKVLIIELWGIGDLVMASSVFNSLKRSLPGAQVSLLCRPVAQELFLGNGLIDGFFVFDFPWLGFSGKYRFWNWDWPALLRIIQRLRKERFDLVLDARGDVRNNFLSYIIGGRRRAGYTWTGGAFFLTDPLNGFRQAHRVEAWLNLLRHLNIAFESPRPALFVTEQERHWQEEFCASVGISRNDIVVGIHPGAGRKSRRWPLEKFIEVARIAEEKHKARVVFFLDPDIEESGFPEKNGFILARPTLRQLLALTQRTDLFIGNDSGPMHIAAAFDRPVVAIFGPGDFKRIGPYGERCSIVAKEGFVCRPCYDSCRFSRQLCIDAIEVKDVAEQVARQLRGREYAVL